MEATIFGVLVTLVVVFLVLAVRWEMRHRRSTGERASDWLTNLMSAITGFFR